MPQADQNGYMQRFRVGDDPLGLERTVQIL
jgi:hypothetical protein